MENPPKSSHPQIFPDSLPAVSTHPSRLACSL